MAEDWLRERLVEDAQRTAAGQALEVRITFVDAAEEYRWYVTEDRGCKPSTIRG
jgi:hypothetical protein